MNIPKKSTNPIFGPSLTKTKKSKKLKDLYDDDFLKQIFKKLNGHINEPNKNLNLYRKEFKNLELFDRLDLIANILEKSINASYRKQLKILTPLLGEPYPFEEGMFDYGFHLFAISKFIEKNAYKDLGLSLDFIEELTKRFTGEFAVRAIGNIDLALLIKRSFTWSHSSNFHLRRLASEGLRLRLPWGVNIKGLENYFDSFFPIYEKLKTDPVLYVRRSVANAMGDLIKHDEKKIHVILKKWVESSEDKNLLRLVKHAIRYPVKKESKKYLTLNQRIFKEL